MKSKLFIAFVTTFLLSIAFPILEASVHFNSYTTIVYLDASVGFILLALVTVIYLTRKPIKRKSRRISIRVYKTLLSLPVFLLMIYFADVDIDWPILLIGLAWRFWLLALILEELVTIYRRMMNGPGQQLHSAYM